MTVKNSSPKGVNWQSLVAPYQKADITRSIVQICNSIIPFMVLWYLMTVAFQFSYLLTLLLAIPTAGFMVRIFIIQHDCGHGSFFNSRKANDWVGAFCSVFTLTAYRYWQKSHAIHHAHAGNLTHRGIGDVYTMTVNEYLQASTWQKIKYRIYRNPFFLFIFIPGILFLISNRLPLYKEKSMKRVQSSVHWTNLSLAVVFGTLVWLFGWQTVLLVHVPMVMIAASVGTWLFFVQHQFEDAYWAEDEAWDYNLAALKGSSYYKLPKIMQWFTGNIGFHHIHHLSPKIPNYRLAECHETHPMFRETVELTLRKSFESVFLYLWDEDRQRLVSLRFLKQYRAEVVRST